MFSCLLPTLCPKGLTSEDSVHRVWPKEGTLGAWVGEVAVLLAAQLGGCVPHGPQCCLPTSVISECAFCLWQRLSAWWL